jgi:DNA mismatch repair protein PMS2
VLEAYFAPSRATYDVSVTGHMSRSQKGAGGKKDKGDLRDDAGKQDEIDELDEDDDSRHELSKASWDGKRPLDVQAPGLPLTSKGMDVDDMPSDPASSAMNVDSMPPTRTESSKEPVANNDMAPISLQQNLTTAISYARPPSPVQVILSTRGASWNLCRDLERSEEEETSEPPRKKQRSGRDVKGARATDQTGKRKVSGGNERQIIEAERAAGKLRSSLNRFAKDGRVAGGTRSTGESESDMDVDVGEQGGVSGQELEAAKSRKLQSTKDNLYEDQNMELDKHDGAPQSSMDTMPPDSPIQEPSTWSATQVTDNSSQKPSVIDTEHTLINTSEVNVELHSRPEVIRTAFGGDISLQFDMKRVANAWHRFQGNLPLSNVWSNATKAKKSIDKNASLANVDDVGKAADILSRVIDKEDFGGMEIVGQFNKGFIVARLRKSVDGNHEEMMDDLFIVDQHAADEKYNFETLQLTTKIQSQKLFRWVIDSHPCFYDYIIYVFC